jgi:hypothetical protein
VQTVRRLGGTLGIAVIGSVVLLLTPHHLDRVGTAEAVVAGAGLLTCSPQDGKDG